jgi:hypothetical protein
MVKENYDESITVVNILLRQLGVKITTGSVEKYFKYQSDKNNLFNISHALTKWKVANAAYHISVKDFHLVPCPFLAKMSYKDARFVIVTQVGEAEISFCGGDRKRRTHALSEFSENYEGVVLAADADEQSGEPNYRKKRRAELIAGLRLPVLFLAAFFCLATALSLFSSYFTAPDWRIGLLAGTKSLGLFTVILLVIQAIDQDNQLVQKICHFGNVSCSGVVRSAQAKILWGTVNWSEVGLLYFSSTFLLLTFYSESPAVLHFLGLAAIACLPYTCYSIYYQGVVIRSWCLLCCFVQVLFWLEALLFLPFVCNHLPVYSNRDWAVIGLGLALPLACWIFVQPFLFKSKQVDNIMPIMAKFLYNEHLFAKILQQQPKHSLPEDKYAIIFGKSDARNKVTVIVNPFCAHCAETVAEIIEVFERPVNFELQLLFAAHKEPYTNEIPLIRDILSINRSDSTRTGPAIQSWFKSPDYRRWSLLHEVPAHGKVIDEMLSELQSWCSRENISSTPTILVNGYELPDGYSIQLLPELLN